MQENFHFALFVSEDSARGIAFLESVTGQPLHGRPQPLNIDYAIINRDNPFVAAIRAGTSGDYAGFVERLQQFGGGSVIPATCLDHTFFKDNQACIGRPESPRFCLNQVTAPLPVEFSILSEDRRAGHLQQLDPGFPPERRITERRRQDRRQRGQSIAPTEHKVSVWIVDHDPGLTERLKSHAVFVSSVDLCCKNFRAVPCFSNADSQTPHPDLILLRADGEFNKVADTLKCLRKTMAAAKIVLLDDQEPVDCVNAIIRYRVAGLFPLNESDEHYFKMIFAVYRGELWFSKAMLSALFVTLTAGYATLQNHAFDGNVFTKTEHSIISLASEGLTNKQIAERVTMSPETVKKHLSNIFHKSKVNTRTQLVYLYSVYKSLFE